MILNILRSNGRNTLGDRKMTTFISHNLHALSDSICSVGVARLRWQYMQTIFFCEKMAGAEGAGHRRSGRPQAGGSEGAGRPQARWRFMCCGHNRCGTRALKARAPKAGGTEGAGHRRNGRRRNGRRRNGGVCDLRRRGNQSSSVGCHASRSAKSCS